MADESELDRLSPEGAVVKLSNGSAVRLVRLKTIQLFALMKILTHGGMGAGIMDALDFSLPPEEFVQRLLTILVLSIPDAALEAMQFIRLMVEPEGLAEGGKLSKKDQQENQARWEAMNVYLSNPPPEDTLDIIVAVIKQEAPEFQALGKRLAQVIPLFTQTGQHKDTKAEPVSGQQLSAAASPDSR
jgi:hypothetical protein